MKILKDKLVVYDSDCPLCFGLKRSALRLRILAEEDCTAYRELPAQYSAAVDPARFLNEMALVDRKGGPTLYGTEGLMHVFSTRYPLLEPLFAVPSLRSVFRAIYSVVAPNRYVLATPRANRTACACHSAGSRRDRLRYIGTGLFFSLLMTVMFALSISALLPDGGWPIMVAAIASGWVVYMLIAAVALRRMYLEFAAHIVSVMWRGTLLLTPVLLASLFTSAPAVLLPFVVLCVVASFGYMLFQHERRMQALCLRPLWTTLWAGVLWACACGTVYILWGTP